MATSVCFPQTENGSDKTSICLLQLEKEYGQNFHLFAAIGKGIWIFVFLGRQRINSNCRLLFQQTSHLWEGCLDVLSTHV
jgi:hypothetical protein